MCRLRFANWALLAPYSMNFTSFRGLGVRKFVGRFGFFSSESAFFFNDHSDNSCLRTLSRKNLAILKEIAPGKRLVSVAYR